MKEISIRSDHGFVANDKFQDFERIHSMLLPRSFKSFVGLHDQPWLVENYFRFINIFAQSHMWPYKIMDGIDSRDLNFLGFNEGTYDGEKIFDSQDFDVYGHESVIAFGQSANGDYICFDYRHDPATEEPRVVVMFHDAYDSNRKMLICPVSNSFEEFMDSLYKSEDE